MENRILSNQSEWTDFEDDLHFDADLNTYVQYKSEVHHMDYTEYGSLGETVFEQVLDVRVVLAVGNHTLVVPMTKEFKMELREILEEYLTNQVREDY